MSRWHEGQQARVVECVDATRKPMEGGAVYPAEVLKVVGPYVIAEIPDFGQTAAFWVQSGWTAWDGMFRWRLMPLPDASRES
jgi:hypothetical protein